MEKAPFRTLSPNVVSEAAESLIIFVRAARAAEEIVEFDEGLFRTGCNHLHGDRRAVGKNRRLVGPFLADNLGAQHQRRGDMIGLAFDQVFVGLGRNAILPFEEQTEPIICTAHLIAGVVATEDLGVCSHVADAVTRTIAGVHRIGTERRVLFRKAGAFVEVIFEHLAAESVEVRILRYAERREFVKLNVAGLGGISVGPAWPRTLRGLRVQMLF